MRISHYSDALLGARCGFPVLRPSPCDDLPESARRTGITIGDVGVMCQDGSFDVLFNICRASDDTATNRFGVPPNFEQALLSGSDIHTHVRHYAPGSVIARTSAKKKHLNIASTSKTFQVPTSSNKMGLLHLPDGASSWDLRSQHIFRDYALKHARSWYKFVNGDLQRMVGNGDLYLVTGVTKSTSWRIMVGNKSTGGKVFPEQNACITEWENAASLIKSGPFRCVGEEAWQNQTVFIRGFKVALRSLNEISQPSGDDSGDGEWLDECVPNLCHPSDIINQYLLNSVRCIRSRLDLT
ncbi:hypothetical protein B0H19DRAFT_681258 [Mycena capillaripes]|nr:hypothetical protein B0H19DRAFT_681258 [Mycena capillaripes]